MDFLENLDIETLKFILIATSFTCLFLIVIIKDARISQLQALAERLNRSLGEMDEQAKLIVRTDLELNKTQEELDKKISGLYTLQKMSRSLSKLFNAEDILSALSAEDVNKLGFNKCLIFIFSPEDGSLHPVQDIGYTQPEIFEIMTHLDKEVLIGLIKDGKTLSSNSKAMLPFKEKMNRIFKTSLFVLSPILPSDENKGVIFMGDTGQDSIITEGDEELVNILANNIAQSLDNARLFYQNYKARIESEKKVEERTKELRELNNDLKELSRRKSSFVSAVSHELRTPLTSIKGYASILLGERLGKIPQEVKERLEKINKHSDELTAMVNDLLDISRIESGKVELRKTSLDLKEVASSMADLLDPQIKSKKLSLILEIPDELRAVKADKSQIERVFINLLGNAVKFTPENGKISLKARSGGDHVEITVSDTGIGIPADDLPFIFDEFYRVDNDINDSLKGTGLGLSLVKYIITAHGGRIWARSGLNQGTDFHFTLPVS